jgi:hypothetical protein
MKEDIGNKVEYDMTRKFMKITQPVLVQSLSDEFQVNLEHSVVTPGVPGQVLTKGQADVGPGEQERGWKTHSPSEMVAPRYY